MAIQAETKRPYLNFALVMIGTSISYFALNRIVDELKFNFIGYGNITEAKNALDKRKYSSVGAHYVKGSASNPKHLIEIVRNSHNGRFLIRSV